MQTVTFPWPPTCLWPNSRKDRRGSTDVRAGYKRTWWATAKEAKAKPGQHLHITFCPPTAARRDLDNMLGAIKYGLDGLALAVGQDDSEWGFTIRRGDPVKGGAVIVQIDEQFAREIRGLS